MKMLATLSIFVIGMLLGTMNIHSRTAAAQVRYNVSPVIEKFDDWGGLIPDRKLIFYNGWANGLFTTTQDPGTLALGRCLENASFEQIVATIDKRYADNRDAFHNPIGTEIIKAVTAAGSPCGASGLIWKRSMSRARPTKKAV